MTRDEAVKVVADVLRSVDERGTYESDAACILDAIGFDQMQDTLDQKQARIEELRGGALKKCEKGFREALDRVDRIAEERDAARALADQLAASLRDAEGMFAMSAGDWLEQTLAAYENRSWR